MVLSTNSQVLLDNSRNEVKPRVWIIAYVLLAFLVSCYFFPFELTFLPKGLNTKIMLAAVGILFLSEHVVRAGAITLDEGLVPAILFAVVFSIFGFLSMEINNSDDASYASYFISFGTWLCASYAVYRWLKIAHQEVTFRIMTNYLVVISVVQCFLALLIDSNVNIKLFVDQYIAQDTVANVEFLTKVKRLYGIGAALDVAGTRFSIVLICLIGVILNLRRTYFSNGTMILYWSAFMVIAIVGNMISRTTTVGVMMAFCYLLCYSNLLRAEVSDSTIRLWRIILMVTAFLVSIAIFLYQVNDDFREQLRFGFEGFFNFVEKGTWTTSSTERLNSVMWIWPEVHDIKTWIIGKAEFDDWHAVGTDIGYCRFIFYNGLLGLVTFSMFFLHNAWTSVRKFPEHQITIFLLLITGFVIWFKVATDIFLIYALLYMIDRQERSEGENRL
ncbi:hypothetical protein [Sphingobacterium ginsenosidimutans]|uniref:O-antigen ligase domain-containing protein n=1 Tax=Sphingobacterium ginsenosidimutans TaxID=687845 RepID=A0ABP7ZQP8_9SPHI